MGASTSAPAVNAGYLQQRLHYSEDGTKLLDADGEAVMMGWEVRGVRRCWCWRPKGRRLPL